MTGIPDELVAALATAISPDARTASGEPNLLLAISDRALTVIDDVLADCGDNTPSLLASNIAAVLAPTITEHLEAIGLPVLLERVEAADQTMLEAAREMDAASEELRFQRRRLDTALIERAEFEADRDALAAKVANAWDEGFLTAHYMERGYGPFDDHPLPDHLVDQLRFWNPHRPEFDTDPFGDDA